MFNWIGDDWRRIKNHCRTTDNKDFTEKDASDKFKRQLLISEHTPIRLLEFDWSWKNIYYWLSTEWSRHKFEKFISTQRDDRTNDLPLPDPNEPWTDYWDIVNDYVEKHGSLPRGKRLQETPVNYDGYANMQNLIDAWRKRLCGKATEEARELAIDFKAKLHETHPIESDVLVPNCIYRMGCPEFHQCRRFKEFIKWVKDSKDVSDNWITDIQQRYDLFNEYFYTNKVKINEENRESLRWL